MIDVDQARAQLMAAAQQRAPVVRVPLRQALGRVLAVPVSSPVDVPPADNSAVDGYAVAGAPVSPLPVSQRIAAGTVPERLAPGTAARIFTGATVPAGADRVVMQENCTLAQDRLMVSNADAVSAGANIRPRGQDVRAGEMVLAAGEKLLPWHLGLLASVGIGEVEVYAPLRVAVLSTGDELQEPGEPPEAGKIFNSNRYQLLALLQQCGFDAIDGGRVADDCDATEAALASLAHQADVVITSGGVSVGEEDHVRAAVQKLGELTLWKVAIKPGKPFAFGRIGEAVFAGLPGNPSALLVTFLVLLKPFLDRCQGRQNSALAMQTLPAGFTSRPGKRQEYLRVRVRDESGVATLEKHPNQSSGMLSSACWAEGLAVLPADVALEQGDRLAYMTFAELMR